ncbi:hypothetical protein M426DRAFT_322180 [Hypoxylon sp. CI-4A]|nr:hypothetical protein M426DRAFT_322180 [Hypoxylon sp. CI-4A]
MDPMQSTLLHGSTAPFIFRRRPHSRGAAIPMAVMTAAVGLYAKLGLPQPWTPATEPIPFIIHGASSAVGACAVQLARKSNIHPIIAVAGQSKSYVETLIDRSKGDTIIDYRDGDDAVVEGLKKASGGSKILYAFDATSEKGSYVTISKALSEGSKISVVLPPKDFEFPAYISQSFAIVGSVITDPELKDFGHVYFRYITRALQDGWLKPQPQVVVPGGLGGIQKALEDLKAGKAHAVKYVFRIAETEGVQ